MIVRLVLSAVIVTGAMAQAEASQEAGFACDQARSPLERAICADPDTAQADRAMGIAYQALITQAKAPDLIAVLQADQRAFLAIRQEAWDSARNPDMARELLRDSTELRAEWLNWIDLTPAEGLEGHWANAWGHLAFSRAPDGSLHLAATVVDQVAGSWICGFEGGVITDSPTTARAVTLTETLMIQRNGPFLEVTNDFCDESGPAIRGSMKGLYLRLGAP